jgi:hypothetical protein
MKEKTRQALEDCVEKANKLWGIKFDEHVANAIKGFREKKKQMKNGK